MSVDKPNDDGVEAFKATIDKFLVQFGSHKETLLSLLRDAQNGDSTADPFDAERAWHNIELLARLFHAQDLEKQKAMSNAEREARFRKIAEILGRARDLIDDAMNAPDLALANDLVSGWWEGTSEYAEAAGRWADLLYIQSEFKKTLENLAALQSGAVRAADGAHKGRGRPRGGLVLTPNHIYSLADVYRSSTGSKPRAGEGPFARFVLAFLSAIERGHIVTDAHVIALIKGSRTYSLQSPGSEPSPFDD
jgi:hypothetical protein